MLKLSIFLLSFLSFHHTLSTATKPSSNSNQNTADNDATNFIKAECRATLYPSLCIQCLSTYNNSTTTPLNSQKQLAQAALSVSLSRAQSAASFISKAARIRGLKPIEYRAVKDCVDNMANTVDQLSRAVNELGGIRRKDFNWHESNVESWVAAALTFQNTCLEGFSNPVIGGSVEVAVRVRVLDCSRVTSNALALVHRYAAKHKVISTSSETESTVNLP